MSTSPKYSRLPTGVESNDLHNGGHFGIDTELQNEQIFLTKSQFSSKRTVVWTLLVTAMTSIAFILLVAAFPMTGPQAPINTSSCAGKTSEELQRDCRFDIISFSWLPPACFDDELTAEWESLRTWEYYTSSNGTEIVPIETVRLGLSGLYSTWEQHLQHCIFVWRKFNRAVVEGRPVDGLCSDYHHTLHCGSQLIEGASTDEPLTSVNTFIKLKTPDCRVAMG